ncbi:M20/M25/M40 family metallo-hydrolase [Caulobacter sp. NIBR2454]|uniref:M20/M25/M40 family metallo-hydrolase n=1 Tax=Caulobacter sp. NIBR2454 TaxID=3015996 RepID=UPI0022B657D1|nr:M20/M25/M40 family metallo-hydrolase [Caulobacter sp. NIBR2454]
MALKFLKAVALCGSALVLSACVSITTAPAPPPPSDPLPPLAPPPPPVFEPSAQAVKAHMTFLASDMMEGREAGTRGYDMAAAYVASRFEELGLKPAGDYASYLQKTPLVSYASATKGRIVLQTGAKTRTKPKPLVFGEDYLPGAQPVSAKVAVNAPMVFVGYGIVAPERGRDDYAGIDVKGKVVVVLTGAPSAFQTEERAHYAGAKTKRVEAAKRGAVGLITLYTPMREKVRPFARGVATWQGSSMSWRETSGAVSFPGASAPPIATLSLAGARKLMLGAPYGYEEIMRMAADPDGRMPTFALPLRVQAAVDSKIQNVQSANVAGVIQGSDPTLRDQVIVLSAHLDHEGISEKADKNGDKINNGAMDNASGIATMLEVARGFVESPEAPRRSVMFLAVTAEEKGLVGADYFANNPTVPKGSVAANVNLDMPILTYPFQDVIAFGAERSNLGPAVRRAAEGMGVKLSADPLPEEGLFTRSDHYRFVEQGVPSVFLMTGFEGPGREAFTKFLAERYHKPSDDLDQGIDYAAGAKFAKLNYEIARELANMDERPAWNAGDFFGNLFGRK